MHNCARFCANQLNRCVVMAVFDCSRWRLSALLDFYKFKMLTVSAVPTANVHRLAKFRVDRSKLICQFLFLQDGGRP